MKSFLLPSLMLGLLLLLLGGCSLFSASEDDEARIIFGVSIDNVEIGDHAKAVRGKLGEPDEIVLGDFAGKIFSYTQGKYNGIQMMIHDDDEKGVLFVSIDPPYSGTTREGIGIGTSRSEVLEKFGQPASSEKAAQSIGDTYFFDDVAFVIGYRDQAINTIMLRSTL